MIGSSSSAAKPGCHDIKRSEAASTAVATQRTRIQKSHAEPLLSPVEEAELATRVAMGDAEARERMILANLGLVVSLARTYDGCRLPLEDLVSEGNLGLMRAVEGYDPDFGVRFSTYAAHWIKQSIHAALQKGGQITRLPAYMAAILVKWHRAEADLARRLGRTPSDAEVDRHLELSQRRAKMARAARLVRSTGTGADRDGRSAPRAATLPDRSPEPAESLASEEEVAWLRRRLAGLDTLSSAILSLRYGLPDGRGRTQGEVAEELGLTRDRVRQLEKAAIGRLAHFAR